MSSWDQFYESGEFKIDTTQPSGLVAEFADRIPLHSRVADIGCGAGRNAIYLAQLGHHVSASDIVDLGWHQDLDPSLRDKINFEVSRTADLNLPEDSYGAIVMMRLLQYLSPEELSALLPKVGKALRAGGIALASYVVSGGRDKSAFDIQQYVYPPEEMTENLQASGLTVIESRNFPTISRHLPYSSVVNVCELVAQK